MKEVDVIKQIDYICQLAEAAKLQKYEGSWGQDYVPENLYLGFKAAGLSLISKVIGHDSSYYELFESGVRENTVMSVLAGASLLKEVKNEVCNGWLTTVKKLITAEVFANFLEMAEHLLEEDYKDAAAVMIGSTLEEHLRQLCDAYKVDKTTLKGTDEISKKADMLNADLKKAGAYNTLDQKQVTAWLGIRNSAAHGKYDEYSKEQVVMMYDGVLNFISRVK